MKHNRFNSCAIVLACIGLLDGISHAQEAYGNLVTNGGFESVSQGTDKQLGYSSGPQSYKTDAVGWTTDGYNFLFSPGVADTTGVTGAYGNLQLWGSNNGGSVVLPASSPDGGNYIAADGAFGVDPISQTVNGLVIGNEYEVSFWWAAAQQFGYNGATTEQWTVSLGDQTQSTSVYALPEHSFSGWMRETMTFTATSTSALLSFLAVGTPEGLPPFALLDGVSLQATAVPEASTPLIAGAIVCCASFRRRRNPVV